jgi:hypothetical protein
MVVVVVVVVEEVVDTCFAEPASEVGTVEDVRGPGAASVLVFGEVTGTSVVVGTAVMEICCDAVVDAY